MEANNNELTVATENVIPGAEKTTASEKENIFDEINKKHDLNLCKPVYVSDIFKGLLRFICDKNPLYLLSAMLILYAQTVIFRTGDLLTDTAIPALVIAGYSVLMTGAAILIVRCGKVWDDARSIVLLLLMLFMVISASIDGIIINTPESGRLWLGGGLMLTLGLSELLCLGMKIRITRLLRTVYYLLTALFFIYPSVLAELVITYEKNTLPVVRGMMLFPVIAGLIFLLLLPMIRDNREYRKDNGTPWRWPAFPLTLFSVMGLGVMFRTYLFSISFYGGKGVGPYTKLETGFGFYMLIPFLLVIAILILAYALRSTGKTAWLLALLVPALLPLMGLHVPNTHDGMVFLSAIPGTLRPISIALLLTLGYYAFAWFRGLRGAAIMFHLTLLGMAGAQTGFNCYNVLPGATWSIGMIFVLLLAIQAVLRRSSVVFALTGFIAIMMASGIFLHTDFTMMNGVIPAHLLFATLFLGGILFHDSFAAIMRLMGAWALVIFFCGLLIRLGHASSDIPAWSAYVYTVSLLMLAVSGWIFGDRYYRNALFAILGISAIIGFIKGYGKIEAMNFQGAEIIFWSILTFIAALIISLYKGGVFRHLKAQPETED